MFEPLIFSDLDGTLIFSASRKQPGDIVCEYKDNREISCITKRQAELLPGLTIIPVTTRSIEQYRRIRFPEGFSPEYALTDNGGTLLVNGVPDPEWARRTMRLVQESSRGLERCRSVMEQDLGRNFEIRMVDGMFLFTKSTEPESMLRRLNEVSGAEVSCFATGAKVYALPAGLCKGAAVNRLAGMLKERRGFSRIVCAGDSAMDIPMLNAADTAVFPGDISGVTAAEKVVSRRERFPEFVTEYFSELCKAKQKI